MRDMKGIADAAEPHVASARNNEPFGPLKEHQPVRLEDDVQPSPTSKPEISLGRGQTLRSSPRGASATVSERISDLREMEMTGDTSRKWMKGLFTS